MTSDDPAATNLHATAPKPNSDAVLLALEALRDDVRRVGRAVLTAKPETQPAATSQNIDHSWAYSLLPLVDSLARCALAARTLSTELNQPRGTWWARKPHDPRVEGLAEGMRLNETTLEAIFLVHGYRLDQPAGVPFDASRHRVVATEPIVPPQTGASVRSTAPLSEINSISSPIMVVRTESAGLWHHDRLLREAGVVVSTSEQAKT